MKTHQPATEASTATAAPEATAATAPATEAPAAAPEATEAPEVIEAGGDHPTKVQSTKRPRGWALQPPWKPGQSGNPRGKRRGGASIVEWVSVFVAEPKYGGQAGLGIIAYEARHGETQAKQIAARRVLRARRMRFSRAGRPVAHDDLEGILDRDLGKAHQSVSIDATVQTLEDSQAQLVGLLRSRPELLPAVIERLCEALPQLRGAILERIGAPALAAPP